MDAQMSLYDMAKQMVANEEPMEEKTFKDKVLDAADKMVVKCYWMLLCRERNDYTVFDVLTCTNKFVVAKELSETLKNRGDVLLIDEQPDGAFEIWIRDPKTKENFAYYLFDYGNGVIKCND